MKAITFDFWDTLFAVSPAFAERVVPARLTALQEALDELGCFVDRAQIHAAYQQAAKRFEEVWGSGGNMTPRDRVVYIFQRLEAPQDPELIDRSTRILEEAALLGELISLPGVKEVVPKLARSFALGIISDTGLTPGRILKVHLERHGLKQYFSAFSFSDETGVVKPHPRAFEAALHSLGVTPAETAHVGDIPRTDIAGARALGFAQAILYTGQAVRPGGPEPSVRITDHHQLIPLLMHQESPA